MFESRDPIHQTVSFSDEEKSVIDHRIFQRMRFIRQLGISFLVYPGACHDRFSHMMGAMHIAGRVWDNIAKVSGDLLRKDFTPADLAYFRKLLRFSALLHDVGHAPFSHVSEKLMPKLEALEVPKDWYIDWKPNRLAEHEDYSVMMIAELGRQKGLPLGIDTAQDIASLVSHGIKPSKRWVKKYGGMRKGIHEFLGSLISGEIDVDRMDYLLRDAHYTGVAYGVYDMDHLVRNLGVMKQDGRYVLTVDSTAVRAFEDFLLARYHMFLQVYHHKTTNAFDHFLKQAFGRKEVSVIVPGSVDGYLDLRDSTFVEALFEAAKNPLNHWSRRFIYRQPARRLFEASGEDPTSRVTMRKLRMALEKDAVPHFTVNSFQYLSKLDAMHRRKAGPSRLLVRSKRLGKLVYMPIERHSSLLKKYNEALDIVSLYVLPEDVPAAEAVIKKAKLV